MRKKHLTITSRRFQSTLPAREATRKLHGIFLVINFNPRFPRGKRRILIKKAGYQLIFQSTLPAREATQFPTKLPGRPKISIHASREGSDCVSLLYPINVNIFQSTLPAREATSPPCWSPPNIPGFQSTLPAREATWSRSCCCRPPLISIHASREGSDLAPVLDAADLLISIHASREGSDGCVRQYSGRPEGFQSTLPAREATKWDKRTFYPAEISIHASREGSDHWF